MGIAAQVVPFFPSNDKIPLNQAAYYTDQPLSLLRDDALLFIRLAGYLPYIVIPLFRWVFPPSMNLDNYFISGRMDELYPSFENIFDITLHSILVVAQSAFLISIPFVAFLPFSVVVAYIIGFTILNYLVCFLLNGSIPGGILKSTSTNDSNHWKKYEEETWIFVNGVAVGRHWLQMNIDRLSRTFHRPILGVHNKTAGIIFDVIQCIIERCLYFGTSDMRTCYQAVADALCDPTKDRIVLIVHSQGGISGSIMVDWLIDQFDHDTLSKLEIYTFGNAANHFNNPRREKIKNKDKDVDSAIPDNKWRAIRRIEHYANSKDFVSRWGCIHFKSSDDTRRNAFHGGLFERTGGGHQFNQHYLDNMFPLDADMRATREPEEGDFMLARCPEAYVENGKVKLKEDGIVPKVRDRSRLWQYRNGMIPTMEPWEIKEKEKREKERKKRKESLALAVNGAKNGVE